MTRITAFIKSILSPSRSLGTGPKASPGGETESTIKIRKLIQDLNDSDFSVRTLSAMELGRIGPDARDAVPALTSALSDKDAVVRYFAKLALEKIELK